MKFSGIGTAFVALTFLSAFSVASAQPLGATTDTAVQLDLTQTPDVSPTDSERESSGAADAPADVIFAKIIYFESPVALAEIEATTLVESRAAQTKQPVSGVAEQPSLLTSLSPKEQAFLQRAQSINTYEQALEELEFEGGAWSNQIAEELTTLGTLLQEQGNYEESLDIFDRAIHIRRVNLGLFSPQQIPLVEQLANSYVALQQWTEADEQEQYAFYVQLRTYGPNDPRMIDVFQNLASWNIETLYRGVDPDPGQRLMQTFQLYNAAVNTVAAHFGTRDPRYIDFLQDMAGASDLIARFALPGAEPGSHPNPNIRQVTTNYAGSNGDEGGGELALRLIVDFYSDPQLPQNDETLKARADAIANLGDWYLMRNRRQAAMQAYQEAYELLSGAPEGKALAEEAFGKIVFLPTYSTFEEEQKKALGLNPDSGAHMGYIDMSFDVTPYGRASNFAALTMEPAGLEKVEGQVVEMVRNNYVRPRIIDGKAVSSPGERYRFTFWY